jgi:pimeloyl-ACP methyl ester carboxylesterase
MPLVACLALLAVLLAAASAQPATLVAVDKPIPPEQLQQLIRTELGPRYDPAKAQAYLDAHALLERYFAEPATRRDTLQRLTASGLDPNDLGRLCRVRAGWPDFAPGVYYINEKVGATQVSYFLGIPPKYDRLKPWPMLVKLPSPGQFLTEPKPNAEQVAQMYTGWVEQELKKHPDAVVCMPLLNLGTLWGPTYRGMNYVMAPMMHACERANIDPARVYLMGHSAAGHAVWNLALHYPTYFAGIMPLAGAATGDWQRLRLINLRNVSVFCWHDANDDRVKVAGTRQLMQILKRFGFNVVYTETKNVGHVPNDDIVEPLYAQLVQVKRPLYPKDVRLQSNRIETQFNRADWLQLYDPRTPGDEQRMVAARGNDVITMNSNPMAGTVTVTGPNAFDITANDNLDTLRIYVNDEMVDFAKPVKVTVRGKVVGFQGTLTPSVEVMLKDQLLLGRGWRFFTATIDLESGGSKPTTKPATRPAATQPTAGS